MALKGMWFRSETRPVLNFSETKYQWFSPETIVDFFKLRSKDAD
jgi:hypothetical protein